MNILLLSALLCLSPGAAIDEGDEHVVGRVAGEPVTADEYGAWLVERLGFAHAYDFLRERMLLAAGEAEDALPTDEQVEAVWQAERRTVINNVHHGSESDWRTALFTRGTSEGRHAARRRAQIRAELVLENLAQRAREFTEEQIQQRYKDIYGALGERLSLRVLKYDMWARAHTADDERPDPEALRDVALERAEAAHAAWKAGAEFEALLAEADDPNSEFVVDGEIGVYRKLLLGSEVHDAVTQLDDVGEISPPVRVWDGYFVVQLIGRETATFEEARNEMIRVLKDTPPSAEELGAVELRLQEEYAPEIEIR